MHLSGLSGPLFNGAKSVAAFCPETEGALAKESHCYPHLPNATEECFSVSHSPPEPVLPAGAATFPCQMTHPDERLRIYCLLGSRKLLNLEEYGS
jgi:hypothetical protein